MIVQKVVIVSISVFYFCRDLVYKEKLRFWLKGDEVLLHLHLSLRSGNWRKMGLGINFA